MAQALPAFHAHTQLFLLSRGCELWTALHVAPPERLLIHALILRAWSHLTFDSSPRVYFSTSS
eukprot:193613-Pleurochrysis_carterae.AAC.2